MKSSEQMLSISGRIINNAQFQLLLISVFILFVFKLIIGSSDSLTVKIISDLILLFIVIFLALTLINYINKKQISALVLVMNVGIVNAILFLVVTFADSIISLLFKSGEGVIEDSGLIYTLVSVAYTIMIVGLLVYLLIALRHLYYLKQGNNLNMYFNTMLIIFGLASLTNYYFASGDFSFISNTFFIVSILLIAYNSIKISWIAFIVKKEKFICSFCQL
jgi:hypothetical protein